MVPLGVILFAIIGWIGGGIVNLLADQLPETFVLKKPDCRKCGNAYGWGRYMFLGRCIHCDASRNIRAWLIQFLIPLSAVLIYLLPDGRLPVWLSIMLIIYFTLVAVIDIEHRLILGPLSIAGMVIGAYTGIYLHGLLPTILGFICGIGIMGLLYMLGRLFSRWMSRKRNVPIDEEALGFGDVYIAGIIGLLLGWPGITAGLVLAIILGGLISGLVLLTMTIIKRYKPFTALPYAPFMLVSTIFLLFRN